MVLPSHREVIGPPNAQYHLRRQCDRIPVWTMVNDYCDVLLGRASMRLIPSPHRLLDRIQECIILRSPSDHLHEVIVDLGELEKRLHLVNIRL
jgi:hypothetical protein